MAVIRDEIGRPVDRVDDEHIALLGQNAALALLAQECRLGECRLQALLQKLLHGHVVFGDEVGLALFGRDIFLPGVRAQHNFAGLAHGGNDKILSLV